MKLPYCFSHVGLAVTEEVRQFYAETICASTAIRDTSPATVERMKKALESIYC